MTKIKRKLNINNLRGEIASTLTIISFIAITAGIFIGSALIRQSPPPQFSEAQQASPQFSNITARGDEQGGGTAIHFDLSDIRKSGTLWRLYGSFCFRENPQPYGKYQIEIGTDANHTLLGGSSEKSIISSNNTSRCSHPQSRYLTINAGFYDPNSLAQVMSTFDTNTFNVYFKAEWWDEPGFIKIGTLTFPEYTPPATNTPIATNTPEPASVCANPDHRCITNSNCSSQAPYCVNSEDASDPTGCASWDPPKCVCVANMFCPSNTSLSNKACWCYAPTATPVPPTLTPLPTNTPTPHPPIVVETNLAQSAVVTTSSDSIGYGHSGATDGHLGGYLHDVNGAPHPNSDQSQEWASNGEKSGAWIVLEWATPQTISKVRLWDRPNKIDQITNGQFSYVEDSDPDRFINFGPQTGQLKNNKGPVDREDVFNDSDKREIVFSTPRTTKKLKFTVTGVSTSTRNVGLSEIAVIRTTTMTITPLPTAVPTDTPTPPPTTHTPTPEPTRPTTSILEIQYLRAGNYTSNRHSILEIKARLCLEDLVTCAEPLTIPLDNPLDVDWGTVIRGDVNKVNMTNDQVLEVWGVFEETGDGLKNRWFGRNGLRLIRARQTVFSTSSTLGLLESGSSGSQANADYAEGPFKDYTSMTEIADIIEDGCVNVLDGSEVMKRYYEEYPELDFVREDVNHDTIINGLDYSLILSEIGNGEGCAFNQGTTPTP